MRWLTAATCCLIFGTGLMLAFAETAEEARMKLQGTWTAIKAERDGKAADDLVGHRLSFTGKSFQIQSKDGTPLYAMPQSRTRHVANAARMAPLSVLTDCISFLLGSGLLRFAPVRERQYREGSPWSEPLVKASIETSHQFVDDPEPASPPDAG